MNTVCLSLCTLVYKSLNLTPHKLNVLKEDGSYLPLPPSGTVARVSTKHAKASVEDGVAVYGIQFGEVIGAYIDN